MLRATIFALVIATAPLVSVAQMVSHYASYDNLTASTDANGNVTSITITETLDGYSGDCMCGALHTGNIAVNIAGLTASRNTGAHYPTYYMNISTSASVTASDSCWVASNGCYVQDVQAWVDCTVVGTFFSSSGSWLASHVRPGKTIALMAGQDPGTGCSGYPCSNPAICRLLDDCTPATTPPTCRTSGTGVKEYAPTCPFPAYQTPFIIYRWSSLQSWSCRSVFASVPYTGTLPGSCTKLQ